MRQGVDAEDRKALLRVFDLGLQAARVWYFALQVVDSRDNRIDFSQAAIARELDMSPGDVSKAFKRLIEAGFVTRFEDQERGKRWLVVNPNVATKGFVAKGSHAAKVYRLGGRKVASLGARPAA